MTNDGVHLEDCQTNVFALTELTGLKWRFYVTPEPDSTSTQSTDPFDSIDQAYGRCLRKGHLCTWRRNGSKKELWVFWYQDADYESIKEIKVELTLTESEDTSADGIPYETRVIFFKALHTKMEVALRKSGYVNFGKWFANPVELPFLGHRELIAEHMTTFNFHFMVYGENTVAAIMSVQRQRPLSWLTKAHFNKEKQEVILGPWGMKGTLIGKPTEPFDKHFEDWQNGFGHLPEVEGLPKMVLVEINGVKTLYPTIFVCVVLDDNLLLKDLKQHYDEEANMRRHMHEWHKVSLMSFEEGAVVNGITETQPDMDLRLNCSQPGSNCPCEMCRNLREFESKYDLTPAALEPTCSNTPDGFLFQSEQPPSTLEPASQDFEDELKAIEEELKAAGGSWHMADNFDGIAIKGLDSVNRDVLAKLEKSDLPEVKKSEQTPSPFVDPFKSESPANEEKKELTSKENKGPKLFKKAQELIQKDEDLQIKRSEEISVTVDPLKLSNTKSKAPKRKVLRFPVIVTSHMDDISCDNKGLTLMRVGTDDLSIDMSPASLDDTSEPAYRHELVVSAPSSSTAPPPQEAHPPRLFPEVVQPPLLSPPVSNEHYEPVETNTAKAPKAPPPKSPVAINALKIRNMACDLQSDSLRSIFRNSSRYSKTEIKRMKTAKQTQEYNNLNEKYLRNMAYHSKDSKPERPFAIDFRKLTKKLEEVKKVVPEKELQWYEKEFQMKPSVPRFPPRYSQPNRAHHFHPYQRMMAPGQMGPGQMGPGPMGPGMMGPGSMGPGSMGHGPMGPNHMGPGAMGPHGQMNPMMRPHMYHHMMSQNNPPQQAGMLPAHWNHQLRQTPYMNSPTYMGTNMGPAMGQPPNPTAFSPSYGPNFGNRPANYMATPPHRAALPSPSPGPTAIGTPATPGSVQQPASASTVFSPPPSSVQPPSSVPPPSVPPVSSVKPATEVPVENKALAIVVQLQDTVLNVHFDAAFEACPMCGCQGNIFGRDYSYITPVQPLPGKEVTYWSGLYDNKSGVRCMCAFSAIRHRFLCYNAGLFTDDAREATGIIPKIPTYVQWFNADSQKDHYLMNLVRVMSQTTVLNITNPHDLKEEVNNKKSRFTTSEIQRLEVLAAMRKAFEGGAVNADLIHPWAVEIEVKPSRESEWIGQRDDIQAIVDQVKEEIMRGKAIDDYGSMTWRQLSTKLSRKGDASPSRYLAEPIPLVLAGVEKEHGHRVSKDLKDPQSIRMEKEKLRSDQIFPITIAPTAIRHWERLQILPYSEPKNIMYIGVVPDDATVERKTRNFLECLSIMYENCQLGRHIKFPCDEPPEGVLRLMNPNKSQATDNRLEAYTECFEHQILRLLRENDKAFEKRTFHLSAAKKPPQPTNEQPPAAASPFASAIQPSPGNHDMPSMIDANGMPQQMQPPPQPKLLNIIEDTYNPEEELELLPHIVVIYVINPFSFGSYKREAQYNRDATIAILNAFNDVLYNLLPSRRIQLQLQIIDIHKVLNMNGDVADIDETQPLIQDYIREVAFNVYSQSRTLLAEHGNSLVLKSMTAFGLRSRLNAQMRDMSRELRDQFYTLPSNPFILTRSGFYVAPKDDKVTTTNHDEKVMFVTYCLLGQDWLLVAVTDGQGMLIENGAINLTTRSPNARYIQAKTQILDAMGRLWQYIMGVLSAEVKNWRVVINRLGRIGHGELKAWGHLLSKSNIQRYCTTLKEKCKGCTPVAKDCPVILSACLVSLEPEVILRVLPTATKKSPDAISSTHIMVFPNASLIQTDHTHNDNDRAMDFDNMDFLEGNDEDVTEDLIIGVGMSDDGQKTQGRQQRTDFFNVGDDVVINNQPLATGYYISTAPAADLPDWFWTCCPSARHRSPVHLRSSLHLTVTNSQSEEILKQSTESTHPLEATATEDVLRFVLESYNALSWLDINISTGDRRSCLPKHIQALLRHYHNMSKLMSPIESPASSTTSQH